MSIKTPNNLTVIIRKCTNEPYRFAIDFSNFNKFNSTTSKFLLLCKNANKGYLIPFGIIKKYIDDFTGSGTHFPLTIDARLDQIIYQGRKEDIGNYCKSSKEIESILNIENNSTKPDIDIPAIRDSYTTKQEKIYPSNSLDDNYNMEQEEIVNEIKREISRKDGNAWDKYKGAITAQVIIYHLNKHLSDSLKIVGHDFFIHNYRTEFDAMVVKKDAKVHFNAYELSDVMAVIEIKMSGFWKEEHINKLVKIFNNIRTKALLISAKCNVPKSVKKKIENSFIFSNPQWITKNYQGEWKRLVDFVQKL